MAKVYFKRKNFIIFGAALGASVLSSMSAHAASSTIHAPCVDGPATTAGLRSCTTYIPQLLQQISSNQSASYPIPLPSPSSSLGPGTAATAGMMQMYASAYYQGVDLDVSPMPTTLPGSYYPGNKFGPICELVPSNLNHNKTELVTQDATNNPNTPSCGKPMQIGLPSVTKCSAPTDDESALLQSLNMTPDQLEGLTPDQAQALLTKAAAAKPNVVAAAAASSKTICITLDASGTDMNGNIANQNGSLERTYLRGTFLQALSYYNDQVLAQLQCQHTVTVAGASCQKFAANVTTLTGSTQSNMSALQNMLLQNQPNLKDIDACNIQSFNSGVTATAGSTTDPAVLRQSAQLLCSARSALEAAFSNLVMCNIFSQAQTSYISNTGAPALQASILNQMNVDLDKIIRPACKSSQSMQQLQSCLQPQYNKQMPIYLTGVFQKIWPQPTPPFSGACVGGTTSGN